MVYLTARWLRLIEGWAIRSIISIVVCAPILALAQSPDETAVRALIDNFFVAIHKEDINALQSLCDVKAPEFEATKQRMQRLFTGNEKIEIKNLLIRKLDIDGVKATARVSVDLIGVNEQTKALAARSGKMDFTFRAVKDAGAWKVWQFLPTVEDLAAALTAAETQQEREALLAANQDLVTVELRKALSAQGSRLVTAGRYPQSLAIHQLARDMSERIGDKPGLIAGWRGMGVAQYYGGNYPSALEYLQTGLALAEEIRDKQQISGLLTSIGIIYQNQSELTKAVDSYQKALTVAEELGSKSLIGYGLQNLGSIYHVQGDFGKALETFQRGLKLFEELGDKRSIGVTLNRMGLVYIDQGDYAKAREHFQKQLVFGEELADKGMISASLHNFGLAYYSQRNYAKALEYYHKTLALKEEMGDKRGIANALNGIGVVYEYQGDYAQALEYYRKSLMLSESLGHKDLISHALHNTGSIYRAQGDYAKAFESYQKSLKLIEERGDRKGLAIAMNNIGVVHRLQGNYIQAMEYAQKSLDVAETMGDKVEIAAVLQTMGDVYYYQKNYTKAIELTERAASIARQIGNLETVSEARTTAGNAYRALNQPELARQAFDEAITSIESVRTLIAGGEQQQQQYFETKISPYEGMVKLLVAQNNNDEALFYAERAKARVLLDVLRNGKVNIAKAMTAQEQHQEQRIRDDLASINAQIERERTRPRPDTTQLTALRDRLQKARLGYETFRTSLYVAHPALKVQRGEVKPLTAEAIAALLPDTQTALLEYVVTDEKSYLFVSTRNSETNLSALELKAYVLDINRKDLTERAEKFRSQLARRDLAFGDLSRQLYDLVVKPAEAQLKGRTSILIVPDGALWELPFQALQSGPGHFLLEDRAISYVPSATVLQEMVRVRRSRANDPQGPVSLLAFGNPSFGKQTAGRDRLTLRDATLQPLPETEKEVKYLAELYGPARSKVYIGAEAGEDRMKAEAPRFTILHLATHGILNDINPMYSQVVLAQGSNESNEDGLLEAWEIMKMDLKADLVVLSACETARGRIGKGEGMIGLTWALFVAGSPTNVVSQWKVESVSTSQLMLEFHRNLKNEMSSGKKEIRTARALQQAAKKLLRTNEYRHPFYWAGFVVIGGGF